MNLTLINDIKNKLPWPDPTPEMLNTPEFNAIWECIKSWDIHVPDVYIGYCGATGNHVRSILDFMKEKSNNNTTSFSFSPTEENTITLHEFNFKIT